MNIRKLLGCALLGAVIISLIPHPSLGLRSGQVPAAVQEAPLVTGQLVQARSQDPELSRVLRDYDLIKMDPVASAAQVRNRGKLRLKSSKGDFDLQLTPYDLRAPDYSAQVIDGNGVAHKLPKTEVNTYRGVVNGVPDAQVRLSLTPRGLEGAIISRDRRYFIQPARALSAKAGNDEFVLYEGSEVNDEEAATCALSLADEVAAQEELAQSSVTEAKPATTVVAPEVEAAVNPVPTLTTVKIARIATDADGEYVAAFGGAAGANSRIIEIINLVDGVYQVEIGVGFQIAFQNAFDNSATDPYNATEASALLNEFRTHWNANFPNSGGNTRSLAHLFTGKNLDGSTVGIAFTGVTCRTQTSAYGLSQRFPFTAGNPITSTTMVLTAHEIGHNFSASHTNVVTPQTPVDITAACQETIMEASINNGGSFCPFSRSQITGHANAFSSCLLESFGSPPASANCVPTPITVNAGATNGSLSPTDCRSPSRGVNFFADHYSFDGLSGQRIFVNVSKTGGSMAPQIYLIGPDGYFVQQVNNGSGGVGAATDVITLPFTGTYIIEVTSFSQGENGSYTVFVSGTGTNCRLLVTPENFKFPAAGGNGTVNVTAQGCFDPYNFQVSPSSATWVQPEVTQASGTRSINFTVQSNPNSAGRRAFLVLGISSTNAAGGLKIQIEQSGTGPDCAATPINFGQTLNGELTVNDCQSPVRGNGFSADRYIFNAAAGQRVVIQTSATSGNPDTFLTLLDPRGVVLLTDDDSGGAITNSRIPGGNRSLTLGVAGTYTFEVTGFLTDDLGPYSVTLTSDNAGSIQLSAPSYSVNEGAGFLSVDVTRSGNTAGPATVNLATSDTAGLTNCTTVNGIASERCDYATTVATLRFAAGETSKNVVIPIVNDVLVEGNETFTVTLSGANGAILGTSTATVTIVENDTQPASQNPIDGVEFFVTQQYIDFLGRLPDSVGLANWVATLGGCPNGGFGENLNPSCDRVHVSSGFFLSVEFQQRGYFAYRFYEVALDRRPNYAEFVPDMAQVGGAQSPESEILSKAAYTDAWTQRPAFKSLYDGLSNSAYVNALEANAEVILANKQALIDALNNNQKNRGQVLREIVETQAVADRFFNRAFVSMQYFGYLRRDPDTVGFQNWLDTLNADPNNFRHMIFGFLFSTEYRQRFGP
ncbi:MAG TPA: M12 family metallo-peptidase [Pyrinomonadaceae bacterium]|nr:M12 family metallo-peptidase [Pyrinomonadaceae bacterium]